MLDKPHISQTGNASGRRDTAFPDSGASPETRLSLCAQPRKPVTASSLRRALAETLRVFARPLRKRMGVRS